MSALDGFDLLTLAAADSEHLAEAKALFIEYANSLGIDLSFQNFHAELDSFPAGYVRPDGALILARRVDKAMGCVGIRRLEADTCEMKRLYVRDGARGSGLGDALCRAAFEAGKSLGYSKMRLDTLPSMSAARSLYRKLGFREIAPYYHNPIDGTSYMERDL